MEFGRPDNLKAWVDRDKDFGKGALYRLRPEVALEKMLHFRLDRNHVAVIDLALLDERFYESCMSPRYLFRNALNGSYHKIVERQVEF